MLLLAYLIGAAIAVSVIDSFFLLLEAGNFALVSMLVFPACFVASLLRSRRRAGTAARDETIPARSALLLAAAAAATAVAWFVYDHFRHRWEIPQASCIPFQVVAGLAGGRCTRAITLAGAGDARFPLFGALLAGMATALPGIDLLSRVGIHPAWSIAGGAWFLALALAAFNAPRLPPSPPPSAALRGRDPLTGIACVLLGLGITAFVAVADDVLNHPVRLVHDGRFHGVMQAAFSLGLLAAIAIPRPRDPAFDPARRMGMSLLATAASFFVVLWITRGLPDGEVARVLQSFWNLPRPRDNSWIHDLAICATVITVPCFLLGYAVAWLPAIRSRAFRGDIDDGPARRVALVFLGLLGSILPVGFIGFESIAPLRIVSVASLVVAGAIFAFRR